MFAVQVRTLYGCFNKRLTANCYDHVVTFHTTRPDRLRTQMRHAITREIDAGNCGGHYVSILSRGTPTRMQMRPVKNRAHCVGNYASDSRTIRVMTPQMGVVL